jgi:hypothetical protein
VEVRYHAGNFYRPAFYEDSGDRFVRGDTVISAEKLADPNGPQETIDLMSNCGGSRIAIVNAYQGKTNSKVPKPESVEFDLGDNAEKARGNAEDYVNGFLIVDGRVWKRVHEPVLVNHADDPLVAGPEIHRRIITTEPSYKSFGAPPHFAAHRIDRIDRWECYREPEQRERLKVEARDIKVLLPDVFTFDEERNAMRRSVESFLELVGQDAWRWDRERIELFLTIRDRFQRYRGSPRVDPIEDILDVTADFMTGVHPLHERYRIPVAALGYAAALEPSIEFDVGLFPS